MFHQLDSALFTTYNYVLDCGSIHEIKAFSVKILEAMDRFCPYDQGRIYYYNENGHMCDQHLVNISPNLVDEYHSYYSKVDDGRYSFPLHRDGRKSKNEPALPEWLTDASSGYVTEFHVPAGARPLRSIDWSQVPKDEFVRDYISYIGISHSIGFGFYDTNNSMRLMFMMDRTCKVPYEKREVLPLCLSIPQLENLYQNLTVRPKKPQLISPEACQNLTKRESEIVALLCTGSSTQSICGKLHISSSTLYTHIAHIFQKLHVSSRQELLAKMMGTDIV